MQPPLSPLDRWIRFLDRSPVARTSFYLGLPAALIAALHLSAWTCGAIPFGALHLQLTGVAVLGTLCIGAIHYTDHVAGRAAARFRPALQHDPSLFDEAVHTLTSVPVALMAVAIAAGVVLTVTATLSDPTFFGTIRAGACQQWLVLSAGWFNSTMIILATIVSVRDLALIRRLHAAAPVINLFERSPLFAFSTLSSRIALLFAILSYGFILVFPTSMANPATKFYLLGINTPLMLIIFVYPLYGMHLRMAEEKGRLLADSARRIESALATLHQAASAPPVGGLDPHRRLTSLIEEESYLHKIPTWPWEPGTLTAVLTAVFLPLMLVIAQQVVRRVLGG